MPSTGMTREALAAVDALVNAASTLPGVRADRVALFGHSRGAVGAVYTLWNAATRAKQRDGDFTPSCSTLEPIHPSSWLVPQLSACRRCCFTVQRTARRRVGQK